ncbi:MAG: hypothetical protein IPL46_19605 [Saprospiraceae bacterium]|nr:hypothetical protein [Saprospiraceae bacterium]
MHQTINDEELKFDIKESQPAFPLKRYLSIAAALILGILITSLYFIASPGSAQMAVIDPTDPPDLYGTGGDEIPLFEEVIQVRIEYIPQENPAIELAQIRLQIFEAKTESFVIDTSTLSLVLFTPVQRNN